LVLVALRGLRVVRGLFVIACFVLLGGLLMMLLRVARMFGRARMMLCGLLCHVSKSPWIVLDLRATSDSIFDLRQGSLNTVKLVIRSWRIVILRCGGRLYRRWSVGRIDVGAVAAACRTSGARGIIRIAFPALTDRATLCRPSGAGLLVGLIFWWRFALDALLVRAAWEKRRQSRRTPKVLGGAVLLGLAG
jgi:hypothetical protein